jgi:hypothetical protein
MTRAYQPMLKVIAFPKDQEGIARELSPTFITWKLAKIRNSNNS